MSEPTFVSIIGASGYTGDFRLPCCRQHLRQAGIRIQDFPGRTAARCYRFSKEVFGPGMIAGGERRPA